MSAPEAILFDAGGTLVTIDPQLLGDTVEPITGRRPDTARMFDAHYLAMNAVAADPSILERPDWWQWWLGRYLDFVGVGDNEEVAQILSQTRGMWRHPIPGVVDAVAAVKEAGYRIAVVSNADGHVAEDLAAAGYDDLFDVIIDSTRVGVSKPDPAIFTYALDALGVTPSETWYVGDSPVFDLAGAANAHLSRFVLVDPFGFHDHRPLVASVTELPSLLGL